MDLSRNYDLAVTLKQSGEIFYNLCDLLRISDPYFHAQTFSQDYINRTMRICTSLEF